MISQVFGSGSKCAGKVLFIYECAPRAVGEMLLVEITLVRKGIHLQYVPSNLFQTMHCIKEAFLINVL